MLKSAGHLAETVLNFKASNSGRITHFTKGHYNYHDLSSLRDEDGGNVLLCHEEVGSSTLSTSWRLDDITSHFNSALMT